MTKLTRKNRINVTPAQKLEYVKLMVDEHYSNQQIIEISGASASVVVRRKS